MHKLHKSGHMVMFACLIIRTFQLVFLAGIVFFSHDKSAACFFSEANGAIKLSSLLLISPLVFLSLHLFFLFSFLFFFFSLFFSIRTSLEFERSRGARPFFFYGRTWCFLKDSVAGL